MPTATQLLQAACESGIACISSELDLLRIIAQGASTGGGGGGGGGGGTLSTDGTFAANSDLLYPSQKAAKTYVDTKVAAALTAADGLYVKKAGDTMTGLLTINAATSLVTSGIVGIGTASPSMPLDVRATTLNQGQLIYNTAQVDNQSVPLFIASTNGFPQVSNISLESIAVAGNGSASNLQIRTGATNSTGFGTVRLAILGSNGNVGIGIAAPLARLHITPSASGTDYFRIDHSDGTPRLQVGALTGSLTYGALWFGDIVPSATNYGIASAGGAIRIGPPLAIPSGSNQRAGNATLVGGTLTVLNTTVTANTLVFLTRKTAGGTIGFAVTYTVIAATSFTITSDNVLDTSTYSYLLVENP